MRERKHTHFDGINRKRAISHNSALHMGPVGMALPIIPTTLSLTQISGAASFFFSLQMVIQYARFDGWFSVRFFGNLFVLATQPVLGSTDLTNFQWISKVFHVFFSQFFSNCKVKGGTMICKWVYNHCQVRRLGFFEYLFCFNLSFSSLCCRFQDFSRRAVKRCRRIALITVHNLLHGWNC